MVFNCNIRIYRWCKWFILIDQSDCSISFSYNITEFKEEIFHPHCLAHLHCCLAPIMVYELIHLLHTVLSRASTPPQFWRTWFFDDLCVTVHHAKFLSSVLVHFRHHHIRRKKKDLSCSVIHSFPCLQHEICVLKMTNSAETWQQGYGSVYFLVTI